MLLKLALLVSVPALLLAQSTGSIVGTVADTSGAVFPQAAVKVINKSTDQQSSTTTDSAGRFSFPRLPVGDYRLEVSRQGFRSSVSDSIRLDADQSRLANFVLEVGAASESVTVTSAVGLVETVGGTIKEVVDEKRMVDLPLNGRNPLQLQLLVPGVVLGTASVSLSQNTFITINGARGAQNNYLLDGGDNNDPLTNSASIVPNPDALVEFSILTNNFSAEYGRNVGGVVNAITKSGTNQFHGALYEFLRNDDLDARNFFSLQKPKLRRNQFGGTLGGPVRIPRLYNGHDRTFFFFSYQGVRDREANTFSSLVAPTGLERQGDFSQSKQKPVDPLTKAAFPGGIIPASRFDPASVNFIKLLVPLPNTPTGQYIYNQPQNLNSDELLGRVDHSLTSKQRLTVRTFYEWEQTYLTAGLPDLHSTVNFHTYHDILNHTYTITPHLLNTAQFTFSRVDLKRGPTPIAGGVTYQSLGVKAHSDTPQYPEDFRGSVSGFWNMNQDNLVYINRKTFQWTDQLSYTIGAHMIKLGGEARTTISDRVTANLTDPQFTFDGHAAVNPMADFLLGLPSVMNQGSLRQNQGRGKSFSLYAQDDYKVRPNFTLSLGLRWEPNFPLYDAANQFSVFRPGKQSTLYPTAPLGLEYAGDPGVPRGGSSTDWKDFGPRAGFAWTPFKGGKTSIRAAYGIFYDTPDFYELTAFANTQPYSVQLSINQPHSFSDPYFGMVDPFPYKPPTTADQRQNFKYLLPAIIGESVDPWLTAAYVQQWNVNIQQQIFQQIVLTAGYVGSKGTRLELLRELNPGIFGPGATLANIDSRRVYAPNFASISDYESTGASTYNALQLSLNKRFSHGYTVLANYTFAKSLDNASNDQGGAVQNPLNLKPEKAPSDFNVGQRFVTSFLWETPSPQRGLERMLLGHWQLNGIFTAQTGTPVNIIDGRDVALSGAGVQRPNLVGDPFLSASRPRTQLLQEFFNPAAFVLPVTGSFGNVGRNLLTGPGSYNMDASLFRSFHLKERASLQFRWEVFNSLNHANLANPVASITSPTVGRILSASSPRILQFGLKLIY
jgi:outer membrane receptor protein involved in Fe transport